MQSSRSWPNLNDIEAQGTMYAARRQLAVTDPDTGRQLLLQETSAVAQAPPTAGTQPLSPAAQEFHPLGISPLPARWRKRTQQPGIDVLGAEVTESSSEGESLPGYVQLQLQPSVTPAGLAIHGPSCGGTSSG